jgi:hypothetical protein
VGKRNEYIVFKQPWRKDEKPEEKARRIKKQESLLEYLHIVGGSDSGYEIQGEYILFD